MENKKSIIYITLLSLLLIEILSLIGFNYNIINQIIFIILTIGVFILSLYKLKYGFYIIIPEIIIGSKGYLYFLEISNFKFSIRIAIWFSLMLAWAIKIFIYYLKNKSININFIKSSYFKYFLIFFIFILIGAFNGYYNHNNLKNLFFDINGWIYFLLIFPIFENIKDEKFLYNIKNIFIGSIIWLSVKTLLILYIFTHIFNFTENIYLWIRNTGIGEITIMPTGFPRIFFQSHIYILIGLFFIFVLYKKISINFNKYSDFFKKENFKYIFLFIIFISSIVISLSRSFWVGGLSALIFLWLIMLFFEKINVKKFIYFNLILFLFLILSVLLILLITKISIPKQIEGINMATIIKDRAAEVSGESALSSRQTLLPILLNKIKESPLLGKGYGTIVTYKSSDPRILKNESSGLYSTYSYEWGWLDIWIKIGLGGLIIYIILLFKIIINSWKIYFNQNAIIFLGVLLSIICLSTVNIFSPYLNHPLGISLVIFSVFLVENYKNK